MKIHPFTPTSGFHAQLTNVPVLANSYWGIEEPYVLESLLIVSNQRSEAVLDGLSSSRDGPAIRKKLDARWPNKFEVAMPTLDANLLCVFAGRKVQQLRDVLRAGFL